MEDDAMVSLAQKCFAGCLGSEHAGLTFDAEVAVEAAMLRSNGAPAIFDASPFCGGSWLGMRPAHLPNRVTLRWPSPICRIPRPSGVGP